MKSTIKLFKAVPIKEKKQKKASKTLFQETIKKGFVFSPEVIHNYSENELNNLINLIEKEIGLTEEQLNSSFHKSWKKVRDANIEQLVIEQLIHYFTTYGFKELGIYSEESVYIPNEKLEIPELDIKGISLVLIKGYTKEELKEKILNLLNSGIALNEETMTNVVNVCLFVELNEKEIKLIKNKEVKTSLYDYLGLVPENPTEFLRYIIYKATDKTLLIKNKTIIEEIKSKKNLDVLGLFVKYKNQHGLEKLAEIFYRFKPLFLAFRTNCQLKNIINKIRRLAIKHHKPMKSDLLNDVTGILKNGNKICAKDLDKALSKANTFRKIRLAYALKYRTKNTESILYKIRNGKGYATKFNFKQKTAAKNILKTVLDSIIKDLNKNVKGKKIYIPSNVTYTLPATEKQFTGDFPSGSYVSVSKDMIVGIHWENVPGHSIDLDLSLLNEKNGKIGWDSCYRTEERDILFSGDITDARRPKGASELFYIKRQTMNNFIILVNYYNFNSSVEVPFKIIVGKEEPKNFGNNYMINPNNVICIAKSKINNTQKILGLLTITTTGCKFYFAETYLGKSITSSGNDFITNSRKYLSSFYRNTISLNHVLKEAGAILVKDKDDCDLDLSPESLEKDKIINLIYNK